MSVLRKIVLLVLILIGLVLIYNTPILAKELETFTKKSGRVLVITEDTTGTNGNKVVLISTMYNDVTYTLPICKHRTKEITVKWFQTEHIKMERLNRAFVKANDCTKDKIDNRRRPRELPSKFSSETYVCANGDWYVVGSYVVRTGVLELSRSPYTLSDVINYALVQVSTWHDDVEVTLPPNPYPGQVVIFSKPDGPNSGYIYPHNDQTLRKLTDPIKLTSKGSYLAVVWDGSGSNDLDWRVFSLSQ